MASQRLHAVTVGFVLASQWHRSVFTLAIHALCRLQMQCFRAAFAPGLRFCFAVASQCLSCAASLFRRRSGITVSPHWQCESRFSVAEASQCLHAVKSKPRSASQWHRSVLTLSMQASLRLRYGIAVASKSLHAVNEDVASASQWHRSVFTLLL